MNFRQQFLYALYVYCKIQEKDAHKPMSVGEGYEPFSCDSPCVPPIGGDF